MIKSIFLVVTIVLCAACPVSVHAQLSGVYKTITLDGSRSDWDAADLIYDSTETGVYLGTPDSASWEQVFMANDSTYLYFGVDTRGPGGGEVTNTWTRNFLLDVDGLTTTGYQSWMPWGYEYVIRYGQSGTKYSLFDWSGSQDIFGGTEMTFSQLITYSYIDGSDFFEFSIPLSAVGLSATPGQPVRVLGFIDNENGGTSTGDIYTCGGFEAEIYTVAEPPSDGTNWTYTVSTSHLVNPERGLYSSGALDDGTDFDDIRAQGVSLCYANLLLDDFRSSNISVARLQEIDAAFSRMKAAGLKCILRITYNNDSSGTDTTLAWMETHLQQLQPLLEDNSELIAFVQAGMIGAWGEWHTSSTGLDAPAGRAAVYDLLCTYLPAGKFINIRTPGFVNELEGLDANPLDDSTAFTGTPRARIAHHNDAWLSSSADMGTYPADSGEMETLKAQVASHTQYAPWGGESAALYTPYTQSSYALAEAERFHATYLNAGYHPDVIAALIANGSWDIIQSKLGYRFELISAALPESLVAGDEFEFEINLKNSGWAPLYNARPVILRILSGSIVTQEIELPADPRFWRPEVGTIVLSGSAYALSSIDSENLGFALWLPDAAPELQIRPDYSVRFANSNIWNRTQGHNLLKVPTSEPIESPIIVDGALGEWGPADIFYADASITDGSPAKSSYENVYLSNDTTKLYIGLETKGDGGGSISNEWTHIIYLDTDMNADTGYDAGWMTYGYDRRIRYGAAGTLFYVDGFIGATQDEDEWILLATITYAFSNRIAELAIPLSALGVSGGSSVRVELNATGTGISTETWAAGSESDAETYTLGSVDSASLTGRFVGFDSGAGSVHMEWHGPTHSIFGIDVSPNLRVWEILGQGASDANGDLLFIDHPPASEKTRFYRAKY